MKLLSGPEAQIAQNYINHAAKLAQQATCQRSRCGAVIVDSNSQIIGQGVNTPPANLENQRRCQADKNSYHSKVTDKTCCLHAEQRAIFDALKSYSQRLPSSKIYFVRLNEVGQATPAGQPYCTICSKMALDVGIGEFILWHEQGITSYDTAEYNLLSYQYNPIT